MGGERERGLERKNGRFKSSEYIEKLLLVSVLKNKGVWVGSLSSLVFAPWWGGGDRHWGRDGGLHTLRPVRGLTS